VTHENENLRALLIFSAALSAAPPEVTPGAGARVKFQAYDGNVKTPEKMEFQINSAGADERRS